MSRQSRSDSAIAEIEKHYTARARHEFLEDLRGQIEDDEEISEILNNATLDPRSITVSFDRKKNDLKFFYSYFDMLLVILDKVSGGSGITKPISQLRVIKWHSSRANLKRVLKYFRALDARLNYRRLLLLPYGLNPVGHNLDPAVYKK